jgi:hypothetical protein
VPRDSIGRRVARAASIGGSSSYKSRTPYGWYSILLAVCVIGIALIALSRHQLLQAAANTTTTTTTTPANTTPPLLTDHWQVALSVDVCGRVENLPASANQNSGIITSGDGVVDIQPARAGSNASQYEGTNATLGKFLTSEGVTLTNTSLTLPKPLKLAGTYVNGQKCGSEPGSVRTYIWSSPVAKTPFPTTNATDLGYANGEMFLVAFVTKSAKIPRPPGAKMVAAFLVTQATTTTTSTTSTTIIGPTTTSTRPGTSTTTKSGSTTTTKAVGTTTTTG